jgi:hypothetical protein
MQHTRSTSQVILYMAHRHSNLKKSISKLNVSDSKDEDREFALRADKALKRI